MGVSISLVLWYVWFLNEGQEKEGTSSVNMGSISGPLGGNHWIDV